MRRSNHNHRADFDFGLSKVMSILTFKRRAQKGARRSAQGANADSVQWSRTFWGRKFIKSTTLAIALLCSASIVLADIKVTTKTSAGGQSMTSTTYIKGARQRTEGLGYTTIYQCDLKRMIQINDKTRTYMITPLDMKNESKGAKPQGQTTPAKRGGVVTYHTTSTDTGERKQMLGLTARHIKSKTVISSSEGACNTMNMQMETDGWYVDLPGGLSCMSDASSTPNFADQSGCVDEIRYKTEGTAKMGYPVMTTTSMKFNTGEAGEDGPPVNMPTTSSMQEVVNISTVTLDAALFDIPAGYTEVKTMQELGSPY
jgi:hypothetical protein